MAERVDKARSAAADLIHLVLEDKIQMSDAIGPYGPLTDLPAPERARAQRLALSTLRNLDRADAVLHPFLRKHPPAAVRNLMRLAVTEIHEEGGAPHGVVNAAVALFRRDPSTNNFAGLANAVLRKAAEAGEGWADLPPQRMAGWLRGRVESLYGRKTVLAIEAAHAKGAPLDLTPKDGDAAALATATGGETLPTGSVRLGGQAQVSALPGYDTGAWWVQDAAAAIPARLLYVQPGERVLDLCAAPGGKTMQLAVSGADVTALDVSDERLLRLKENLKRTGLTAYVVSADALTWQPDAPFDAILLDAPCSATGTIRRHPDLPHVRTGADIKPLFKLQADLIDKATDMLAQGGRMVFCTCSLLPEEGEKQLQAALDRHPDLSVDPMNAPWI